MRKGVTRVKGGYLARHYHGTTNPVQEYFYAHEYGSDKSAYAAAERFLDWAEATYPVPPPKKRKPGISKTYDVSHGNRVPCYEVFWTTYPDGQKHTRMFRYNNDIEEAEVKEKANRLLAEKIKEWGAG